MKVYVVYRIGYDVDYDEQYAAFKVFARKADATAYMEARRTRDGKYWDKMVEEEVE